MAELTVVDPPSPPKPAELAEHLRQQPEGTSPADIAVYLVGNRLQITADVDDKGLAKLKDVLAKYEEILKMLQ